MRLRDEFDASLTEEKSNSFTCPLSQLRAGQICRIRRLCGSAEMCQRLREIGFCENHMIRRLANQTTIICEVCNARLALSTMLAELIWVEPIDSPFESALSA
jgi:ferrous iron transport protein A